MGTAGGRFQEITHPQSIISLLPSMRTDKVPTQTKIKVDLGESKETLFQSLNINNQTHSSKMDFLEMNTQIHLKSDLLQNTVSEAMKTLLGLQTTIKNLFLPRSMKISSVLKIQFFDKNQNQYFKIRTNQFFKQIARMMLQAFLEVRKLWYLKTAT